MTARAKRLVLILFLLVFLVVIPVVAMMSWIPRGTPSLSEDAAIVLEVSGEMLEYHQYFASGFLIGRRELTLTDALDCLAWAEGDERVKALVVKVYPSGAGAAKCQELAEAIVRFRESGKPVVAFSPLLEGFHYLVAAAADSLFMPPAGYAIVPGPASSAMYLRGAFDKLGIKPNIHRIENYKSAAEMFTEKGHTPESRAMTEWLLADVLEEFVGGIAELRGVGADTVRAWIDRGLFSPDRALEQGLIDGIRYWDEVEDAVTEKDLVLVDASDYLRDRRARPAFPGPHIAVIHAQGTIAMGESGFDPVFGGSMGSETIIEELRRARDDENVEAVILRIDSPGGDGIAGDMISREVELVSIEKPVVVSMSDVAASGGYEIAYRADWILAMPSTITGSIGSITGKFNLRGLYDKLGVTKDEIGTGAHSLMNSDYRDFTEEEWALVAEEHWQFYKGWIEEIALFREMPVDSIDALARGRVWTGDQAATNGLVDSLGSYRAAIGVVCDLADVDSATVAVVHYPRRVSFLQQMLSRSFFEDAASYAVHRALVRADRSIGGTFMRHEAPIDRVH